MIAKLANVKAVKAHVRNGQIVLDDPMELPEGAAVEVLVPDEVEPTSEELDEEIELSKAEIERGEFLDARELARKLASSP